MFQANVPPFPFTMLNFNTFLKQGICMEGLRYFNVVQGVMGQGIKIFSFEGI